jgi:hypothetical protein
LRPRTRPLGLVPFQKKKENTSMACERRHQLMHAHAIGQGIRPISAARAVRPRQAGLVISAPFHGSAAVRPSRSDFHLAAPIQYLRLARRLIGSRFRADLMQQDSGPFDWLFRQLYDSISASRAHRVPNGKEKMASR